MRYIVTHWTSDNKCTIMDMKFVFLSNAGHGYLAVIGLSIKKMIWRNFQPTLHTPDFLPSLQADPAPPAFFGRMWLYEKCTEKEYNIIVMMMLQLQRKCESAIMVFLGAGQLHGGLSLDFLNAHYCSQLDIGQKSRVVINTKTANSCHSSFILLCCQLAFQQKPRCFTSAVNLEIYE